MAWRAIDNGLEAVKKIRLLIDQLRQHPQAITDATRKWLDPSDILRFWALHIDGFLQTEYNGINASDLLFLLLCHIHVRLGHEEDRGQQQQQTPIAKLLPQVRGLCLSYPAAEESDADEVFQQCATALVVQQLWIPSDAQSQGEKQKELAFGLDLGTEDDVYDGEEMEQRQGEQEEDAKNEIGAHRRETEMQRRKKGRFLRWCSRAFLENWYVQQVALNGVTTKTSEDVQEAVAVLRPKFATWCVAQAKQEQPRAFAKLVEQWATRVLTGIGAMRQQQKKKKNRDWSAAYTTDCIGWESELKFTPKSVAASSGSILQDTKHPFCELTRLALAVTMFECLGVSSGDPFQSQFLVFRDELLERLPQVLTDDTDRSLPRRPVIVQLPGGIWSVHNCSEGWVGTWVNCPTDALLTWAFLVRRDFQSRTVVGSNINKWVETLTGT